jgi:transketolase
MMHVEQLIERSAHYRRHLLSIIYKAGAGHTGGSLSCIDILNVLYNRVLRVSADDFSSVNRDRYIQSKGHCVEALFVVLADKGFFPASDLDTLCRYGSHYIGHPTRKVHGVEQNTGALGHGLPMAVGTALAGKLDGRDYRVFTLLGDGELPEGSNWEAALTASHYKLDNLCAIVDLNGLQITGPTRDVCDTQPLADKFRSFGWSVREVDGHDIQALSDTLEAIPFEPGKPSVVIAHTVKGKGVSFMEHNIKWHHGVPNAEQFAQAMEELGTDKKMLV